MAELILSFTIGVLATILVIYISKFFRLPTAKFGNNELKNMMDDYDIIDLDLDKIQKTSRSSTVYKHCQDIKKRIDNHIDLIAKNL
jgi:hypothetical protein